MARVRSEKRRESGEHTSRSGLVRKPPWLKVRLNVSGEFARTRELVRRLGLNTVCEEAACPNIGECWAQRHATVMILGTVCTRACAFCNVKTGLPDRVDADEPERLAQAVAELALGHVVVTSVDRDDLPDGGAEHFVACIESIRRRSPGTTIEVLTPDFRHKEGAIDAVVAAKPDVYNHNLETVPRLYRRVRPGADYRHSLALLRRVKEREPAVFAKSGIMVGLVETASELESVMDDLRGSGVDFLTIGQYLRPTLKHIAVDRYVTPAEFDDFKDLAESKGFALVSSTPLTRSSYHADADFARLRARREAQPNTSEAIHGQ